MIEALTNLAFAVGDSCTLAKKPLLGIIPTWYHYLPTQYDSLGKCVVAVDISKNPEQLLLIGLAIIDALTAIAGLAAFGYLMYGGVLYVISQGEPDNAKKALDTIRNALIGLVISAVATTVVAFIGRRLGS